MLHPQGAGVQGADATAAAVTTTTAPPHQATPATSSPPEISTTAYVRILKLVVKSYRIVE